MMIAAAIAPTQTNRRSSAAARPTPASPRPGLWLPGMDPHAPLPPALPPEGPTLQEWATEYIGQLEAAGRSASRINELWRAVHRWQWWSAREQGIGSPLLNSITPRGLADFRRAALGAEIPDKHGKKREVTARSLNKTLGALEQIVNAAAEHADGEGDLSPVRVKKVSHPRQIDKLVIPDAALGKIFAACDVATWPAQAADGRPVAPPATLWKFLLVWWVNYGMRTQDLVAFEKDRTPITWANITTSTENPHHDGTMENEHGWLVFVPHKTAGHKPEPLVLPLSATTRYWLDRLADETPTGRDPERAVAPVTHCGREFYAQWQRILEASGARPKPLMGIRNGRPVMTQRSYKLKHLRCTAATRIESHAGPLGFPGVGQLVTGHDSDRSPTRSKDASAVFARHYYSAERALIEVLTTIDQPPGFAPPPTTPGQGRFPTAAPHPRPLSPPSRGEGSRQAAGAVRGTVRGPFRIVG